MTYESDLRTLVEFVNDDPPILSLYLNVDPTKRSKEEYRLNLRSLLKQVSDQISAKDIQAVEHYFDFEYDGSARGAIIFSCHARELWRVYALPVAVSDRVLAFRRPYITPFQEIFDRYDRYAVILVDKEGGRFFLFRLGELEEVAGILGDELKKHKQGGWSAQRLQRKAEEIAHQNLKSAAQMATQLCQEKHCARVILAGTDDNLPLFRALLPKAMQDRIVGEMSMDMGAGENEVRDKTMEIIHRQILLEEHKLVEQMITFAAKGEGGVVGLSDTLNALQEERIHILLVAEGYEDNGARCTHCAFLSSQPLETCPYCGATMRPNDHVVNSAVGQAIERGIPVKVVSCTDEMKSVGQIGAILRY